MRGKARRYELAGVFTGSMVVVWALVRLVTWVNEPAVMVEKPTPVPTFPPAPIMPVPIIVAVPPAPPLGVWQIPTDLQEAIEDNDPKAMALVWSPRCSLFEAIRFAVKADRPAAVGWLIDKGADANQGNGTPDHLLVLADDFPDVTKVLLSHGAAELDLDHAASIGAVNAVARNLAQDKTAVRGDASALDQAIQSTAPAASRQLIIDKLIAAGASVTTFELELATQHCGTEKDECLALLKPFLARRVRISGDAVVAAVALPEDWNNVVVERFLGGNLVPNATADVVAQMDPYPDAATMKLLAKHGINWGMRDPDTARNPMSSFIAAAAAHDEDALKVMIDSGAPVDWHDEDGDGALAAAVTAPRGEDGDAYGRTVELLVRRGANVNRHFSGGGTALFQATELGETRAVKALLNAGARVNDRNGEETPLDAADRIGATDIAHLLSARGGRRARPMNIIVVRGKRRSNSNDEAVNVLKAAMGATENTL